MLNNNNNNSTAQDVVAMTSRLASVNASAESLVNRSSVVEAELDELETRLRRLQAQADQDALLIHEVQCTVHSAYIFGWRRGVVVSGVRRMNEVNARRARLLPGWVTVFGRVYHLGM